MNILSSNWLDWNYKLYIQFIVNPFPVYVPFMLSFFLNALEKILVNAVRFYKGFDPNKFSWEKRRRWWSIKVSFQDKWCFNMLLKFSFLPRGKCGDLDKSYKHLEQSLLSTGTRKLLKLLVVVFVHHYSFLFLRYTVWNQIFCVFMGRTQPEFPICIAVEKIYVTYRKRECIVNITPKIYCGLGFQ